MDKIAVFYMIGQFGEPDGWKSIYDEQMNYLYNSGLYDKIQFIDLYIKGPTVIPKSEIPDKVNNITYCGDLEEDRPYNRVIYRAYVHIMQRIWAFSNSNPEYKILFFHSVGVSHYNNVRERTKKYRVYFQELLINNWKDCIRALEHYDCVGVEYNSTAAFKGGSIQFEAPHYQGLFWWANASYLKTLDPCYFYQDVEWQPYLTEFWIGSNNPKAYNLFSTFKNRYFDDLEEDIPYDQILQTCRNHFDELDLDKKKDDKSNLMEPSKMEFQYNQYLANHWHQLCMMLQENYTTEEDTTILLGCNNTNKVSDIRKKIGAKRIVVYQLEPLIQNHWHNPERILQYIQDADEIWDYDIQNVELLRSYGIEAKFRPPAYTDSLKRIKNWENPDIDVLFYGTFSEYRTNIIKQLENSMDNTSQRDINFFLNYNMVWLNNVTDTKLDEYIARSKVILNLKPYKEANRQQQTRIYYPLINDKCILSEKADINYFGDNIHQFSSIQQLKDKLQYLIVDGNWRNVKQDKTGWIGKKGSQKIAIFYHIYQTGDWRQIFEDQIIELQKSSLYDSADYIHIGVNGDEPLPYDLQKVNRIKYNDYKGSERDTIIDAHNFAKIAPEYKILFIHAKGVTWCSPDRDIRGRHNVYGWRKYLEYFTIEKWKECVDLLNVYDVVGTEWEDVAHIGDSKPVLPHYSGNFWWSTGSYLAKLDPQFLYSKDEWERWLCEFWIGTKQPNKFSYHNTLVNKYNHYLYPPLYGKIE